MNSAVERYRAADARRCPSRKTVVAALSLLLCLSAVTAHAQEEQNAAPPVFVETPVRSGRPVAKEKKRSVPQAPIVETTSPVPPASLPARTTFPASSARRIVPAPAQTALVALPAPPAQVVTVIHRLSGWKLLAWLASMRSPVIEVDDLPLASEVHTNIVAGFIDHDGRTVVAHLGQAEAEAEAVTTSPPPPGFRSEAERNGEAADLVIVRSGGKQSQARFIGLDGRTGLSLLEVATPIIPPSPKAVTAEVSAASSQYVRLFAPEPARPNRALLAGDKATLLLNMSELQAQLSEVKRGSSGKAAQAAGIRSSRLTPEWMGAVAMDASSALVGIVAPSSNTSKLRLITAEEVRGAIARVRMRRASVPQPWLGVRGNEIMMAPLEHIIAQGWPREDARALIDKRRGVLLTAVAPGTPAALAGLRRGDVIERVSEQTIAGVEDFSVLLREASGGSTLDFTVLRALETAPLKMSVTLSESLNPAFATQDAEVRAAKQVMRAAQGAEVKAREREASARAAEIKARLALAEARATGDAARIAEAQKQLAQAQQLLSDTQKQIQDVTLRASEATGETAKAQASFGNWAFNGQLIDGLNAIAISPKIAARFNAQQGLLVTSVRSGTTAASSGLLAGDVIESINGQMLPRPELTFQFSLSETTNLDMSVVRNGKRLTLKVPHQNSSQ